jgi:predicted TIM-barrel fold metal-dependent hydrolase
VSPSDSTQAPACQGPDRTLRPPDWELPAGSTDCHAHILGPASRFPFAKQRVYTPPDCTEQDYLAQLDAIGVDRAVLVQPSVYGTDNRALLEVLERAAKPLRAIVVVHHDVTARELENMHRLGVRGVRVNIVDVADKRAELPMNLLRNLVDQIAPLGWHLELLAHVQDYPDLASKISQLNVPVVFGHFGYMHCRYGVDNQGFLGLLDLLRAGKAWVKMTGPYRISNQPGPPYDDINACVDAVMAANPEQLLWGSDWPHVMVKHVMPNDADLLNLFKHWVPDPEIRQQILVRNPTRLYGF